MKIPLILNLLFLIIYSQASNSINLQEITQTTVNNNNSKMSARTVQKVVHAMERPEGVGATVRRSIGVEGMRKFTPFLMFDHFAGGEGGFPEHPHLGQETITYMIKGAMAHEDFTGSKGILYPGDLQFMTAGKGIVHSEMPVPLKNGETPYGMQLWVDLPKEMKEVDPRYRDLRAYEIPEVVEQDGKLRVKVISGNAYGTESLKELAYTPVHYYHYTLKPGALFEQQMPENFNTFLYVMSGSGLRLTDGNVLNEFDNAFFKVDGNTIKGANPLDSDNDIEFILVGGQILDQHTVHYGPFVANNNERISKAMQDYNYARAGFSPLKTWKSLISNGVTDDMVENQLGSLSDREREKEAYLKEKEKLVKEYARDEL